MPAAASAVSGARHRPRADKERLLSRLRGAAEGAAIDCRGVLLVAAHPDDETIALGGHLHRMHGIAMLHVTDGAPLHDMSDAHASGFSRREHYAEARRRELVAAAGLAGIAPQALLSLDVPDQAAALRMAELAPRLADLFREGEVHTVLTHAYEGGHPDHDATAFIVHAACRLLGRAGFTAPAILEFPLYHGRQSRMVVQEFAEGGRRAGEYAAVPDEGGIAVKRRMLAAYRTQAGTLRSFALAAAERLRPAGLHDFLALPNGGDVFYGQFGWGLRPSQWPQLAGEAGRALGLPP